MRICSKNQCSQCFIFLILNLTHITTKDIECHRISLVKLLSAAQAHLDPPEAEVVCGVPGPVLLPQPFTGTQPLGQSVELGRRMPCGQPGLWTFLLPGNTWLHTCTNPALPTPVCPGCHGKENQVQRPDGKDMLQQSPVCMTSPSDVSGHATSTDLLVPGTIPDWLLPCSFSFQFLVESSYTWASWAMEMKIGLRNVRVDGHTAQLGMA